MKELFEQILNSPAVSEDDHVSLLTLAHICKDIKAEADAKIKNLENFLATCFRNTELKSAKHVYKNNFSDDQAVFFEGQGHGIWIRDTRISADKHQNLVMEKAGKELREFSYWHKENYFFVSQRKYMELELKDKILITLSPIGISVYYYDTEITFKFDSEKFFNNTKDFDIFELTNNREKELFAKINIPLNLLSEYLRNKINGNHPDLLGRVLSGYAYYDNNPWVSYASGTPSSLETAVAGAIGAIVVKPLDIEIDTSINTDFEIDEIDLYNDLSISTYGLRVQTILTNIVEKLLSSTNSAALEDCIKVINEMIETIRSDIKEFNSNKNSNSFISKFPFIKKPNSLESGKEKVLIDDNSLLKYKNSCVNNANVLSVEYKVFLEQKHALINIFIPLIEKYRAKCQETIANNSDLSEDKINRLNRRIIDLTTSLNIAIQCIATIDFSNFRREANMFKQLDIYTKMIPAWGILELQRRTLLRDYLTSEIDDAFNYIFVGYLQGNNQLMNENINRVKDYLPTSIDTSLLMSSFQTLLPENEIDMGESTANNGFKLQLT